MKRTFLGIIAAVAVSLLTVPAMAQEGPYKLMSGKQLTVNYSPTDDAGRTTTMDVVNFGFEANRVRICMDPRSAPAYVRFGTASSNLWVTVATQATQDRMTVPSDSSSTFIGGMAGALPERAIPFTAMASVNMANSTAQSVGRIVPACYEGPWVTRGIVMHVPTGLATLDVWGFQQIRQ